MKKYFLIFGLVMSGVVNGFGASTEAILRDSLPSHWSYEPQFTQTSPSDDKWWSSFGDEVLDSLIYKAERNNYNAAMAIRRIEIARQGWNQAKSAYFPNLSLSAGWTKGQSSGANGNKVMKASSYDYFNLGVSMNWEIDVFGRVTANAKAQKAALNVSRADYQATMVALAANIAKSYFNLRLYQQELNVAKEHLASQEEVEKIAVTRYECGLSSMLDVTQARITVAATRASIPSIEALVDASKNSLAVITGEMPGALNNMLDRPRELPEVNYSIATGVPADLLRRRPDIVEAEAEVAQYAALLGVAKKDFLPTLSLSGSVGTSADKLGNLFSKSSLEYEIAPTLSWTIFDGLARNYKTAEARLQMENAIDNYNLTVLTAVQEVDTYLSQLNAAIKTIGLDHEVVNQCKKAVELSLDLYKQGLNPFSDVADSQMSYLENVNNLLTARTQALTTLISIYEALGGGF